MMLFALAVVYVLGAHGRELDQVVPFVARTMETTGPVVVPWRAIPLDEAYAGDWLVAGDLDGDGVPEFVAARHDGQAVTTAIAYDLDGEVLWRWGEAGAGQAGWWCDIPLQLYDLDGDGRDEVFLSVVGYLLVLDGATGEELARHPLPDGLEVADCITFADLRRRGRPEDIIVKTRYTRLWAYTADWEPLWTWAPPEGFLTCHHPTPVDVDGDGRDEVLAGYAMLDDDGSELAVFGSELTNLATGHLDCARVIRGGLPPEDARLVITCCGANLIAVTDGLLHTQWELPGGHFESPDAGILRGDLPAPQIAVDIDHSEYGKSEIWLLDAEGTHFGTFVTGYGRHHRLVDWDGDGLDDLLIANAAAVYTGTGECLARLAPNAVSAVFEPGRDLPDNRTFAAGDPGPFGFVGDLDGDGVPEVVLHTCRQALVYRTAGRSPRPCRFGTGLNWTLY